LQFYRPKLLLKLYFLLPLHTFEYFMLLRLFCRGYKSHFNSFQFWFQFWCQNCCFLN
jgi:hypothetical protein